VFAFLVGSEFPCGFGLESGNSPPPLFHCSSPIIGAKSKSLKWRSPMRLKVKKKETAIIVKRRFPSLYLISPIRAKIKIINGT
jgi:hypothetical protein